jgi:hypothetical protein
MLNGRSSALAGVANPMKTGRILAGSRGLKRRSKEGYGTDGDGILVLVPALSVPATGRWRMLRRPSFWVPAVVVAVAWLPWHFYTRRMAQNGMFFAADRLNWAIQQAQITTGFAVGLFGALIFATAIAGLAVTVILPLLRRRRVDPYWASLAALLAGTYLLYMSVTAGIEQRRMLVVAPPLLLFAAAACDWLAACRFFSPAVISDCAQTDHALRQPGRSAALRHAIEHT